MRHLFPCLFALLVAAPAPAATRADAPVATRVERAAREVLEARAASLGLVEPQVHLQVLPARGPAVACDGVEVRPRDVRNPARLRFVAACPGAGAAETEYVVRGALSALVVVVSADVRAGEPLDASRLAVERRDVAAGSSPLARIDDALERSSRRALRAGQPVDRRWLVDPVLVARGAPVEIVARHLGVEVRTAGEALDAGRRSATIRVRNVANGAVIRARVIGTGIVEPANLPGSTATSTQ